MKTSERLEQFKTHITDKYYLYNSLLNHLPYETNKNIGILIPILAQSCHQGFEQGLSPRQIIEGFFERHTDLEDEKDQIDFLFRIIQYIERQIVLFDSVEDSAFGELKKSSSNLSLKDLRQMARSRNMSQALFEKLSDFKVRIVFTAHPTQFYPSSVLRIIHDLQDAISRNAVREINTLLKQLGKTPFLKRTKPTPFEEAQSILYYLRYVYYDAIGEFFEYVDQEVLGKEKFENYRLIELGFWPGGDRDGNPFVTAETTREVAAELRMTLMKCYYNELKVLRRKLTFRGVVEPLETLSDQLYQNMFALDKNLDTQGILSPLLSVREILVRDHYSLYLHELDRLINKVRIFGTHFASLDIRQDSRPHQHIIDRILQFYGLTEDPSIELEKEARIRLLTEASGQAQSEDFEDPLVKDTINNVRQLKDIQRSNGEAGCHRYIISNSGDVFAVLNVVALFKMCGYAEEDIHFDIVPLFETMQAMDDAEQVMRDLFENETYARHLKRRAWSRPSCWAFPMVPKTEAT
jgi:phosphoenolpyruvate carboxylase